MASSFYLSFRGQCLQGQRPFWSWGSSHDPFSFTEMSGIFNTKKKSELQSWNLIKQDEVFYAPTVWQSLVNRFYKVLVYFVSIIMNARALSEITLHKPQNFSVSSRHLYVLGIYGNLQLENILFGGQRLENMCSFLQLQTKYWKTSRESARETHTLWRVLLSDW